jgi:hypothetical protein
LKFVFPKFVLWIFYFYFYIFDSLPISPVEASSRHVQGKGGERECELAGLVFPSFF